MFHATRGSGQRAVQLSIRVLQARGRTQGLDLFAQRRRLPPNSAGDGTVLRRKLAEKVK